MITLYFKDNVSDKVYQVSVDPVDGGYNVNFAYGRRSSTMTTGTKNSAPLTKAEADKLADKLVREKMAKGYTPGETGVAYSNTSQEERFTGILPMLLNPITEEELPKYLQSDQWIAQQKYDGKRMLIRKQGGKVEAINRKGLIVGAPQPILDTVEGMPGDFILDGECIGEYYIPFDLVIPDMPLRNRLTKFMAMSFVDNYVFFPNITLGLINKAAYLETLRASNYEGIVFKDLGATYTPGRPSTGGPALKHKFTATINVCVSGINVQRSVEIELRDGLPCGNVTVPANKEIPHVGDLIEVRYLYAMPNSNALYQPFYSRLRDDIDVADGVNALKYKKEED